MWWCTWSKLVLSQRRQGAAACWRDCPLPEHTTPQHAEHLPRVLQRAPLSRCLEKAGRSLSAVAEPLRCSTCMCRWVAPTLLTLRWWSSCYSLCSLLTPLTLVNKFQIYTLISWKLYHVTDLDCDNTTEFWVYTKSKSFWHYLLCISFFIGLDKYDKQECQLVCVVLMSQLGISEYFHICEITKSEC